MTQSDFHGRRSINLRAALILLGVLAGLSVGGHFLHGFQVDRNARELLQEADRAEQNGDPQEAIDYLAQYLSLAPKDADARARHALLLAQEARTAQDRGHAFLALEKAVHEAPEREDVRRRAIDLALSIGHFRGARPHVEVLLAAHEADADLTAMLGICESGEGQLAAGQEHLRQAVEKDPGPQDPQVYLQYALILRERGHQPEEADQVMRRLLERQGRSPAARLAAVVYTRRLDRLKEAAEHLRFILDELKVRDAGLFLLTAEVAELRGKSDEARTRLEEGAKQHPQDPRLPLELARLDLRQGQPGRARERLAPLVKDLPRSSGDLWGLGGLLIDCGDLDHAGDVIARLEKVGEVPAARCLRARQLMERQAWAEAKGLLEQVRSTTAVAPEVRQRANLLLAVCHKYLLNPDQQLAACQRVLAEAPSSAQARHLLASALAALDRREEAIVEYRKVLDHVPAAVPEMAGLLLARSLALPPGERSWDELDGLAALLEKEKSTAAQGARLKVRILAARGESQKARELLQKERDRDPKQIEPWLLLVALAEQEGKRDSIPALLDEAERQAGRRVEWDLARTDYWLRSGPDRARKELPGLEARLDRLTGADRQRLGSALAAAYEASGDPKSAERLWQQLAGQQTDSLKLRFQLFERALRAGRQSDARRLLEEIRTTEGSGALGAYGEALLCSQAALEGDREALTQAQRHLERAGSLRPSWPRVPLLQAQLLEKHDLHQALEKYQAALELGEDRIAVVQHVVELMASPAIGRYAEANALLKKLPESALATRDLGRLAAELTLLDVGDNDGAARLRAGERALQLARKVADGSKDHRVHLWLGRIAARGGHADEAEKAFRHARDLAETSPEPWVTLILFLADRDRPRAEAELARAERKLSGEKVSLAPAYEALGKREQAEKLLQAGLAEKPADAGRLWQLAGFYARTDQHGPADPLLRRLIAPETKAPPAAAAWARRTLALNLASDGSYAHFKEAESLLAPGGRDRGEEQQDVPTRALVLATRPEHRRTAIGLIEALPQRQLATLPEVQFVLAQLYEADGKWTQAKVQLLLLLEAQPKNPRYLGHTIRAFLRHDQGSEAESWLDRLATLRPDEPETIELRAKFLHAGGRDIDAVQLLREHAAKKGRPEHAARVLEQIGATKEAEAMYRKHARDSMDPASVLALAGYLGRRGQVAEALELCEKAWAKCPPETVAATTAAILRSPDADDDQRRQGEERLNAALAAKPRSPLLALYLATVQEMRGRYPQAMQVYRRILREDAANALALNNLAYYLALTEGNSEEALDLVKVALDRAGADAELLDTRAIILICAGRAEEAIPDLEQVVAQVPTGGHYFHLALACKQADRQGPWRAAAEKARALGFKAEQLPPVERQRWREAAQECEAKEGTAKEESRRD